MSFTAATFGRKLLSLRTDFGQDLSALSVESGIATQRLELLERGLADPTGDEVLVVADHFKKDFRYFLNDLTRDPDADMELLFRERGSVLPPSDRVAIAEFVFLCRSQAMLEQELGIKPGFPGFQFRPHGNDFKGHGENCARELRRHLNLGPMEVMRDVFAVMRDMGFKVFRRRLENSNISGLCMHHPDSGPCVLVNLADGLARQRFSAAHEWGHVLMDGEAMTISMVGEWDSRKLIELRANTFASHMLMPPELLATMPVSDWKDPNQVTIWAERLRVSVQALLMALATAKLISSEERKLLSMSGRRSSDPPDPELEGNLTPSQRDRKIMLLERGLSNHYVNLCFDAYAQDVISLGRLGDMLLTSAAETFEVASLFGRVLRIG